eukprot:GHVR01070259.1.p1 GENE.GHVR01070259.1~~GHVR01070259.1.p1  ORF type:complete len:165 (-),score=14.92 GHVR01070259.1:2017-2511(-)
MLLLKLRKQMGCTMAKSVHLGSNIQLKGPNLQNIGRSFWLYSTNMSKEEEEKIIQQELKKGKVSDTVMNCLQGFYTRNQFMQIKSIKCDENNELIVEVDETIRSPQPKEKKDETDIKEGKIDFTELKSMRSICKESLDMLEREGYIDAKTRDQYRAGFEGDKGV